MTFFNTPIESPIIIIVTIIYFLTSAVETFDIRLTQAKKAGEDIEQLPIWVNFFYLASWVLFIILFLLNWKYAILVFIIKFILKVLPILEIVGNVLMAPLHWKKHKNQN